MNKIFKLFNLILFVPTLMSSTNIISYTSFVYKLSTNSVVEVVEYGNYIYSLSSNADAVMAKTTIHYELLKMHKSFVYLNSVQSYSLNYKITTELRTNVPYKNGLFQLFTEHGNTQLLNNKVKVTFPKTASDLTVLRVSPDVDLTELRILSSLSSVFSDVPAATSNGSAYCNLNPYFALDDEVPTGAKFYENKYNISAVNYSDTAGNSYSSYSTEFTYPHGLASGETSILYGSISFFTEATNFSINFDTETSGVIGLNSFYGESRDTKSMSVDITI